MKTRNSKTTKRSLTASITSVFLCLILLIGATFAWFTDSVTSGRNRITAGNLDVELEYAKAGAGTALKDAQWMSVSNSTELFAQETYWEPGHAEVVYLRVRNAGSLALKYQFAMNILSETAATNAAGSEFQLSDHLMYGIAEDQATAFSDRAEAIGAVEAGAAALDSYSREGHLAAEQEEYIALVVYMPESVGNEANYQGDVIPAIDLGITLAAAQDTVESDSFDDQYDLHAVYPAVPEIISTTANIELKTGEASSYEENNVSIQVPEDAVDNNTLAVFSMEMTDSTADSVTYEISLKDEEGNDITLKQAATVKVNIGTDLTNVQVYHGEQLMDSSAYSYDRNTGILTITTASFSPFRITYDFDPLVTVNGTAYPSVYQAVLNAEDGDTIMVQKSYSSSGMLANLIADGVTSKNITIDLNGNTLEYTGDNRAVQVAYEGAGLTLKNGTITSSGLAEGNASVMVFYGAALTLENVDISSDQMAVFSQGEYNTISIDGGTIQSGYFGIYQNGSNSPVSVTVKNASVTDTLGAGIYISNSSAAGREKQTLTVENCTITGPSAVEVKHTNATIKDSTLIATAVPTGSGENGNGSCTEGYAFALTSNSAEDLATGNITLTDTKLCSVTAEQAGYCFIYKMAEGWTASINGETVTEYNNYGALQP